MAASMRARVLMVLVHKSHSCYPVLSVEATSCSLFKTCVIHGRKQDVSLMTCAHTPFVRKYTSSAVGSPVQESTHGKVLKISKAMQNYLEKTRAHDEMLDKHNEEFEMGRRYLANMMDSDPENFSQQDIDEAISYLLPSGLFSKKARPQMKPPSEIFPVRKAAEFNAAGRPHHFLFYTGQPNFFGLLHSVAMKIEALSTTNQTQVSRYPADQSTWVSKDRLERMLTEELSDSNYHQFTIIMGKLFTLRNSGLEEDFIRQYRQPLLSGRGLAKIPEPTQPTNSQRLHVTAIGYRKLSKASLTVYSPGTGTFDINGNGIEEFSLIHREQIMAPLVFVNRLGLVDVEGRVEGVGGSARAGAVRHALSLALAAFQDGNMQEKMRQAGLLTRDPRRNERQKPGQRGARAKKTWKKR